MVPVAGTPRCCQVAQEFSVCVFSHHVVLQ